MNEPRRWTFLCIWYENRWCWVHEVERLCFRSTWPCVYPSFYGSEPPVSTRITVSRVLTSFVPPVHNQGVSLAPLQGPALWKIFLPTTGSFFVISLTVLHGYRAGTLRWTFRPACSTCLLLNSEFWSPPTAHYFIHPNRNSGGIASPGHDSAAILFILSYHSYVRAWLFAAAMTISALMQGCSCWAPIVSASVIRLSIFLAFPSL